MRKTKELGAARMNAPAGAEGVQSLAGRHIPELFLQTRLRAERLRQPRIELPGALLSCCLVVLPIPRAGPQWTKTETGSAYPPPPLSSPSSRLQSHRHILSSHNSPRTTQERWQESGPAQGAGKPPPERPVAAFAPVRSADQIFDCSQAALGLRSLNHLAELGSLALGHLLVTKVTIVYAIAAWRSDRSPQRWKLPAGPGKHLCVYKAITPFWSCRKSPSAAGCGFAAPLP